MASSQYRYQNRQFLLPQSWQSRDQSSAFPAKFSLLRQGQSTLNLFQAYSGTHPQNDKGSKSSVVRRGNFFSFFQNRSISQKLQIGCSFAFLVTLLGIGTGFLVAESRLNRAIWEYEEAAAEVETVANLKGELLSLVYQQRSVAEAVQSPSIAADDLIRELDRFLLSSQNIDQRWQALLQTKAFQNPSAADGVDLPEQPLAGQLLADHTSSIYYYLQDVEQLRDRTAELEAQPEVIAAVGEAFLRLENSDFIRDLDQLVHDISAIADAAAVEYEAGKLALGQARQARTFVVWLSVVLSGMVGLLVMHAISRLLIRPLKAVTQVAQQSIQAENFDLKATVSSHDEAGLLAAAFNEYMEYVKRLLNHSQATNQQLELALADLQLAQTQMIQTEKMSDLGEQVAGVAHEINNPVSFIHGNLDCMRQYIGDILDLLKLYQQYYPLANTAIQDKAEQIELDFVLEDLPKMMNSMNLGTERLRDIVLSLRTFSRVDDTDLQLVNIHTSLDSTLIILNHRLKAYNDTPEIKIVKNYGELPLVECYPGALNQVFMNLISNAIDAIEEEMTVISYQEALDFPAQITITTAVVDGKWVEIAIADNGPGIPPELQAAIFAPFFTTKPMGKGTGMGMAISQQIVREKHQGSLTCTSEVGNGTEFIVRLPI